MFDADPRFSHLSLADIPLGFSFYSCIASKSGKGNKSWTDFNIENYSHVKTTVCNWSWVRFVRAYSNYVVGTKNVSFLFSSRNFILPWEYLEQSNTWLGWKTARYIKLDVVEEILEEGKELTSLFFISNLTSFPIHSVVRLKFYLLLYTMPLSLAEKDSVVEQLTW